MDYKLTILMPVYNQQEYISEAIESIFAQKTNFDFKLIVIDDASTDDSIKIVQSYKEKYPDKIEILKNETNLKLLRTIIKGYENTKTDYFCVIDPDDYWIDEHKLQKAVGFLEKNPDFTIYATNTCVLKEDGTKEIFFDVKDKIIDSDFNDYLKDKAVLGCSLGGVFRNVVFKNGVPQKLYDMLDSKYSSAFRGDSFRNILHIKEGKVHYVNEQDAVYRIHSNGIWSSSNEFKQKLITARFFIGMYHYFDKIEPRFFLERRLGAYNSYMELVIKMLKTEPNINDSREEIIEMLELISEVQAEYICHKLKKVQTKNVIKLDEYINTSIWNKFYYKIYKHMDRILREQGAIK